MNAPVQAYPLQWPVGWRRTPVSVQVRAKFKQGKGGWTEASGYRSAERVSLSEGLKRVYRELRAFGIGEHTIVVSSDLRLRQDGMPYSTQATASLDQGVAVYWRDGNQQRCMAVDRYDRIADNLAAIAATLEAMRAIERHGGASILDRAFQGFAALAAPEVWWQVLGLSGPNVSRADIDQAHRALVMKHHPDRGTDADREERTDLTARINRARDHGYEAT